MSRSIKLAVENEWKREKNTRNFWARWNHTHTQVIKEKKEKKNNALLVVRMKKQEGENEQKENLKKKVDDKIQY